MTLAARLALLIRASLQETDHCVLVEGCWGHDPARVQVSKLALEDCQVSESGEHGHIERCTGHNSNSDLLN